MRRARGVPTDLAAARRRFGKYAIIVDVWSQGTFMKGRWIVVTERQMVFGGMGLTLFEKTASAVRELRVWERRALGCDAGVGFWGCAGAGPRSAVVRQLCKLAGVKVRWHFNESGLEPPEVADFVLAEIPDAVWEARPQGFLDAALDEVGVLKRRGCWCMREFKEWGGAGKVKLMGSRWAESLRGRLLWETMRAFDPGCSLGYSRVASWVWNPVMRWTDADILEFVQRGTLAVCQLDAEGFERTGCIGCPMRGRAALTRDFVRWPAIAGAWRRAFERLWERKRGSSMTGAEGSLVAWPGIPGIHRWEELFEWWRDNAGLGGVDVRCGCGRW